MNGQQIADELGVTRQNIAQTVKRAMRKVYKHYKKLNPNLSPFEVAANLMTELEIDITEKNFKCFPADIRNKIKLSALDYAAENNYFIPE